MQNDGIVIGSPSFKTPAVYGTQVTGNRIAGLTGERFFLVALVIGPTERRRMVHATNRWPSVYLRPPSRKYPAGFGTCVTFSGLVALYSRADPQHPSITSVEMVTSDGKSRNSVITP